MSRFRLALSLGLLALTIVVDGRRVKASTKSSLNNDKSGNKKKASDFAQKCSEGMALLPSGVCIDKAEQEPATCESHDEDAWASVMTACSQRGLRLCTSKDYHEAYTSEEDLGLSGGSKYGYTSTTKGCAEHQHVLMKRQKGEQYGCHSSTGCWKDRYYRCCSHEAVAEARSESPEAYAFDPEDGTCPGILPLSGGAPIPSMVMVTIKSAANLPSSFFDTSDPHVEFWTGEKGHRSKDHWKAITPSLEDKTNPSWEWSCLLAYEPTNPTISFEIFDSDSVTRHDFLGKATANILSTFLQDTDGDGELVQEFQLQSSKGEPLTTDGGRSVLTVKLQVIREPTMYSSPRRTDQ